MADFNVRSESVDVEQIMKQIRARIREKRGADYTEEQIRELATVRLEKFLDPKNLRSDLLDQFRRSRPAVPSEPLPVEAPYRFDENTLFETHRGPLRFIRQLLRPILKLFFNPNPLINVLNTQAQFNVDLLKREQRRKIEFDRSRAEWNALYYEVLHNLVLETTRSGIEIKNLKMRLESLASRLDFSERRVRALEGVVQYRPEAIRPRGDRGEMRDRGARTEGAGIDDAPAEAVEGGVSLQQQPGSEGTKRRRRRRRGRRGAAATAGSAAPAQGDQAGGSTESSGLTAEAALETESEFEGETADSEDIRETEQSWESEAQDASEASSAADGGGDSAPSETLESSESDLTDDDQQ
jgi:hypothetical protein